MIKTVEDLLIALQAQGLEEIAQKEDIKHNPLIGEMYEGLTQELLHKSIFSGFNLHISSGKIRNAAGDYSKQIDCMLTIGEGEKIPYTNKYIHDIQNVIAVVEVKKTLNPEEIKGAMENLTAVLEVDRLDSRSRHHIIPYGGRMYKDAMLSIARERDYKIEGRDLSMDYLAYSIVHDTALPVRIIYSYYGYKTEKGLRQAILDFIPNSQWNPKFLSGIFPNLIICGKVSIVKYNGMPFAADYDPVNKWMFAASQYDNSIFNMLNVIWYRLCKQFSVPFEWMVDGRIYAYNKFLSVNVREEGHPPAPVPNFGYYDYQWKGLQKRPQEIPWEPLAVDAHTFEVFKLLAEKHEVDISDSTKFMRWLNNSVSNYQRVLQNEGVTNIYPVIYDDLSFESVMKRVLGTGLAGINGKKLEIITSRATLIHFPEGLFIGENRDGRLANWESKRGGAPITDRRITNFK